MEPVICVDAAPVICGGAAAPIPVDEEKAQQLKKNVEFFLKRDLKTYEPKEQLTQVVVGTMNFFKIYVGDDAAGPYIWVKAFEPLQCNLGPGEDPLQMQGLSQSKQEDEQLAFF